MLRRLSRLLPLLLTAALILTAAPAAAQETTHIVQPGENLFRIALRYGLDVTTIARANNISNTWQIYAGQRLVIPTPGQPEVVTPVEPAPVEAAPVEVAEALPAPATTTHTVRRGELLRDIARRYNMTVEQIAQLNNIANPNLIYAGQQLTVYSDSAPVEAAPIEAAPVEAVPQVPAAAQEVIHVVQPGEYLSSIAQRYGVSWLALAQANNIYDANTIFTGQRLIIPSPNAAPIADAGIIAVPAAPPPAVGVGREIVVDVSDSRVYAYENGVLVRNVLGSMGRAVTPTVLGRFTVQRKYVSQAMSGPGYYLPGVPYVMYFYAGYALHGVYWHANWGQPMSHGCVNLPTPEAEWFFNFAEVGTPVTVQA